MTTVELCAIRLPTDPLLDLFTSPEEFAGFRARNCNETFDYSNTEEKIFLRRLYEALLGRSPEAIVIREYHIAVTIFYLFLTITFCRCLRLINHNFTPSTLRPLTADIIATFQTIACGLENGFVRKVYGLGVYSCQTFCLGLWATWTMGQSSSNPVSTFKKFFEKKQGGVKTLIHMTFQMLAALVAYRYASLFWSFELSSEHVARLRNDPHCKTDLNVPIMIGFFIELSATIIDVIVSKSTTKRFKFEHYEQFAKGIFSICMTVLGLNLTGMYLNPANSTAQNFGCRGVSRMEFIFVYWLGPIIGSALGIIIHQNFADTVRLISSQLKSSPAIISHDAEDSNGVLPPCSIAFKHTVPLDIKKSL